MVDTEVMALWSINAPTVIACKMQPSCNAAADDDDGYDDDDDDEPLLKINLLLLCERPHNHNKAIQ